MLSGIGTAAKWTAGLVAGAAAVTTAVAGVVSNAVQSYADYEQLIGGVETLFGNSASTIEQYAQNAYKTAGMTANEYMETATGFAAALVESLDKNTAKAAQYADMAITDMSDNANKMGTSLENIQNAYAGFSKQNYTMLDNLKLGYGGTKEEMQRLLEHAQKLSGVKYDISSYSDIVAAIHEVQKEMGITGTTAAEATETISGSIAMLKARFENFKNDIGAAVAPAVKQFISVIIDNLPVIEAMIGQLVPVIADMVSTLLPPLLQMVEDVFPVLVGLFNALMPVAQQIITAILPILVQLITMLLPPFVQIVDELLPPFLEMLMPLLELLSPLLELLMPLIEACVALIEPLLVLINDVLTPLITFVQRVIELAIVPLQMAFTVCGEQITNIVSTAVGIIKNNFNIVKSIFTGFIDFFKNVFKGEWKAAWNAILDIVSDIWNSIIDIIKTAINFVIGSINSLISGINAIKLPNWVPGIGGKSINIPLIPTLAEGGILKKGQIGLLEGTGAEAVIPLDNNHKWVSAVAQDMKQQLGGVNTDIATVLENVLPDILVSAFSKMQFDINGREFARMVKAV